MPNENQPAAEWKEYPEPEFPNDEARKAYRRAKEKIRKAFFSASPDTFLNFTGYGLSALPPEVGQLKGLTKLYLYSNQLMELPPEIGRLTVLTKLYLDGNGLRELPAALENCGQLEVLSVNHNKLERLPAGLKRLSRLENLRLHGNPALCLPPELLGYEDFSSRGFDARRTRAILALL
jgi:Leucine-rich repeat (LRR) protein